ncbi:MAG TPA: hypothetical protein VLQ90_07840, partial [Pyrinomonadaceae bacterium]|nr:hypothetical protein [Pyrinomonadaceae bacterium]
MKIFPRHVVYFIAFCAILAIAVFCADTRLSGKTSAASTRDLMTPSTAEVVEETVTFSPTPDGTKTWTWWNSWENDGIPMVAPCPRPAHGPFWKPTDVASGQIVAGFMHYWDPGL